MRIRRLSVEEGEVIARALAEKHILDGTYDLKRRPGFDDRYILTPAPDDKGEFTAMTGLDESNGWVTLLQNTTEAVVMLGATAAPFV